MISHVTFGYFLFEPNLLCLIPSDCSKFKLKISFLRKSKVLGRMVGENSWVNNFKICYPKMGSFISCDVLSHMSKMVLLSVTIGMLWRRVSSSYSLLTCLPNTGWMHFSLLFYLINRMPSKSLNSYPPWQKLFQNTPDYSTLWVFGCACYPWLRPYSNDTAPDNVPSLAITSITRGTSVLIPPLAAIFLSRHVTFDKSSFPFQSSSTTTSPSCVSLLKSNDVFLVFPFSKWFKPGSPVSPSILGTYPPNPTISPSFPAIHTQVNLCPLSALLLETHNSWPCLHPLILLVHPLLYVLVQQSTQRPHSTHLVLLILFLLVFVPTSLSIQLHLLFLLIIRSPVLLVLSLHQYLLLSLPLFLLPPLFLLFQ